MSTETRTYSRPLVLAIVVHVVFLAILVVSFQWTPAVQEASSQDQVVKAVAVDENKVQAEMNKLRQAERLKKSHQQQQLKELQEKVAREQQHLKALQKQRQEQAARAKAETRRKAEAQRRAAALARREEARRLADLKRQRQEEAQRLQKMRAQQQALEEKREAEQQRLAKLKAEQEKERKRKEEEERQRKEAEKALQQQLAEEEAQRQAQRDQSIVQQYIELIRQKVTRNWVRPAGWKPGQSCKVDIQLIPGGDVADAHIVDSCGSPLFDQSVVTAVSKASPLPLPPDGALFDRFRDITFDFNPKE